MKGKILSALTILGLSVIVFYGYSGRHEEKQSTTVNVNIENKTNIDWKVKIAVDLVYVTDEWKTIHRGESISFKNIKPGKQSIKIESVGKYHVGPIASPRPIVLTDRRLSRKKSAGSSLDIIIKEKQNLEFNKSYADHDKNYEIKDDWTC